MKKNGATICVETLLEHGVEVIFGYPGGAIMPIYDALVPHMDTLRHILVRHEQGGIHAAEGYSRVTGKPGICFATSGPGATNLITGLADALMDSVPLVCITGQVSSLFLGTDAFQETDVISLAIPVTKWCYQCTTAEDIKWAIQKGFHVAQDGRPGPVLIDITKDAQIAFAESIRSYEPTKKEKRTYTSEYQEVAALINNTEEVIAFIGNGVRLSNASKEVEALLYASNIPFASTLHGLSTMKKDHPLSVGMLGMHGNYAPNLLTNKAKVILALGMRFDDRVTGNIKKYAPDAKIIHVDIDPSQINKSIVAHYAFIQNIKDFCLELTPYLQKKNRNVWREQFQSLHEEEVSAVIIPECERQSGEISMGESVNMISQSLPDDAMIVADVGQHQMSVARYFSFKSTQQFLSSGGLGTMGFGVPAAMGAAVAHPQRTAVAICGDGGFQMTLQELATISQENLNVKIIILNNSHLGMVRQWQELFFDKRYSFVALKNPDFVALSESFGIPAMRINDRQALQTELPKLLSTPGAQLIEIIVENEQNIFPMIPAGRAVNEMILRKQDCI